MSYFPFKSKSSNCLYTAAPAAGHDTTVPDTWRIEMKCAFPGPTATRCFSCLFNRPTFLELNYGMSLNDREPLWSPTAGFSTLGSSFTKLEPDEPQIRLQSAPNRILNFKNFPGVRPILRIWYTGNPAPNPWGNERTEWRKWVLLKGIGNG